jgi:hypothetical protein
MFVDDTMSIRSVTPTLNPHWVSPNEVVVFVVLRVHQSKISVRIFAAAAAAAAASLSPPLPLVLLTLPPLLAATFSK